jgi:hypothetical protein
MSITVPVASNYLFKRAMVFGFGSSSPYSWRIRRWTSCMLPVAEYRSTHRILCSREILLFANTEVLPAMKMFGNFRTLQYDTSVTCYKWNFSEKHFPRFKVWSATYRPPYMYVCMYVCTYGRIYMCIYVLWHVDPLLGNASVNTFPRQRIRR